MGYYRAGFEVVGVDIKPQPHYPFKFIQDDALEILKMLRGKSDLISIARDSFQAIHASPPCQAYSVMKSLHNAKQHPDLVSTIREHLQALGMPWIIENVPGAPLRTVIQLCGSMFGLNSTAERYLQRHRNFESSVLLLQPECRHVGKAVGVYGHGQAGLLGQRMRTAKAPEARILMGMDWATRDGMSQAIPPAYTEFIGKQLMEHLK